ncbi:hypothetical protein F4823DRAFT_590795, partial [Ustulina deusta]
MMQMELFLSLIPLSSSRAVYQRKEMLYPRRDPAIWSLPLASWQTYPHPQLPKISLVLKYQYDQMKLKRVFSNTRESLCGCVPF